MKISRQQYNDLYGPTVGDRIRLANTDLYIEIEKDLRTYGDEVVYGGGKTYAMVWAWTTAPPASKAHSMWSSPT